MEFIGPILLQLALHTPLYLAWLVGIVFSLIHWRASVGYRLALIAFVVFLLTGVISTVMNMVLPITLAREYASASRIGLVLGVLNVGLNLLNTAGWVLILVALFRRPRMVGRKAAAPPTD